MAARLPWARTCREQHNPRHQADAELDVGLVGEELDAVETQQQEGESESCQDVGCDHRGSGQHQLHCSAGAGRDGARKRARNQRGWSTSLHQHPFPGVKTWLLENKGAGCDRGTVSP